MSENEDAIKALMKSIEKWDQDIVEDRGSDNCALCEAFLDLECEDCPVKEFTGRRRCDNTPYEKWFSHHKLRHQGSFPFQLTTYPGCKTCVRLQQKEANFLKSLLPGKKRPEKDDHKIYCSRKKTKGA